MRIAICQPLVPHYRVPVFDLLGAQPGIELTVYAGGSVGSLEAVGPGQHFAVVPSPIVPRRMGPLRMLEQAAQIEVVDPGRYDLVIVPWDAHYRTAGQAAVKARRVGVPLVAWGHGYSKRPRPGGGWLRNRLGHKAAGVMLYTRTIADELIAREGFAADRVFVAQNAIDQRPIQAARSHWLRMPEKLAAFQREHQIDPARTLIFVSRLEPDNHGEVLIEALAKLRQSVPGTKLVLVGKGPARETLERQAAALGLGAQVIFPGAIYDEMALAPWMLSAGIFAYATNIGLSIMHAFGYGLPLVSSDDLRAQGPEVEALRDGENCLLYRALDADDFASKCQTLLENPQRRAACGAAGRAAVLQKYTIVNMVQGFLDAARLVDGRQREVVAPEDLAALSRCDEGQAVS